MTQRHNFSEKYVAKLTDFGVCKCLSVRQHPFVVVWIDFSESYLVQNSAIVSGWDKVMRKEGA